MARERRAREKRVARELARERRGRERREKRVARELARERRARERREKRLAREVVNRLARVARQKRPLAGVARREEVNHKVELQAQQPQVLRVVVGSGRKLSPSPTTRARVVSTAMPSERG